MTTDFSANCFGSTVVISSGLGPPGTRLKYFSSIGIAVLASTSPTTATTMFAAHVVLLVERHGLGGVIWLTSLGQPMPLRP